MKLPFAKFSLPTFSIPSYSSRFVYIGFAVFFLVVVGYALFEMRGLLAGPSITVSPRVLDTSHPLIKISGTALRITSLSMNGKEIPVSEGGLFEESYALTPGYNRIILEAKDRYGKKTERTIEVIYNPESANAGSRIETTSEETATSTQSIQQ